MVYSLDKIPNAPYEIPPPPPYAVWVEEVPWDHTRGERRRANESRTGDGQIRHMPDLAKAKERVRRYAVPYRAENKDHFDCSWAIYLWNAEKGEYEVQYEGMRGQSVARNALFQTRLKKGAKPEPRPGLDDEVAEALASIAQVVA